MAEYGWTFGHLLTVVNSSLSNTVVTRVVISKNEHFIDPEHEMPLDSPVQLCEQYGYKICYYLAPEVPRVSDTMKQQKNAFEILMGSSKEKRRPQKAVNSGTIQILKCYTTMRNRGLIYNFTSAFSKQHIQICNQLSYTKFMQK